MNWIDDQIKQRREHDDEAFCAALAGIADAILGTKVSSAFHTDREKTKNAIDAILRYFHVKSGDIPENITDTNEQLEYLMRPHGIMRRSVNLEKGWYRDAVGAMLGVRKSDGCIVALIPTGWGYRYYDDESGKWIKIGRRNQSLFEDEAIAFYKPFPLKKLTATSLLKYAAGTLSPSDYVMFVLATLAITLLGLLTPKFSSLLMGPVMESKDLRVLFSLVSFMICAAIATLLMRSVRTLLMNRLNTKMSIFVQAATMSRVLSLPADFFKKYSAGELSSRAQSIDSLCSMMISTILSTGLTSVFSLVYISQIFVYAPTLVLPAVLIILATALLSVITTFVRMGLSDKYMEWSAKDHGMSYALISGVQKLKLSGSEKRAFARWGNLYSQTANFGYGPTFVVYSGVLSMAISFVGTIVMYYLAVKSGISVADYYAFNSAYGMVSGALMSFASISVTVADIKPILHMAKPILDAVPEVSEGKQVLTKLSGGIELSNVSFRYSENMPLVADDLSLKIRPGQYVAIVGPTGGGKSTLMRLMLGFETPQKGAVYYDGRDLASLDLKSLRRRIGVVMQDGKLFSGDIYSNIVIAAPWLSLDDAWDAAEIAGLADDIRAMPMGMHTLISEGSGGISGGQRQRMMIARAIAPKPKILMFDEATSALDNLTQKKVSESLDGLKCTRIVIAHRLSTIKACDRILYLDKGKIAEDGTYEELMAKKGKFAELVARQMTDPEE